MLATHAPNPAGARKFVNLCWVVLDLCWVCVANTRAKPIGPANPEVTDAVGEVTDAEVTDAVGEFRPGSWQPRVNHQKQCKMM